MLGPATTTLKKETQKSKVHLTESRYPLLILKEIPTPKYARRSVKVLQDFNNGPESNNKF